MADSSPVDLGGSPGRMNATGVKEPPEATDPSIAQLTTSSSGDIKDVLTVLWDTDPDDDKSATDSDEDSDAADSDGGADDAMGNSE